MKKLYVVIAGALMLSSVNTHAQTVLLNMDFNAPSYPNILDIGTDPSLLGSATDTNWYVFDGDGFSDGSTGGTRPGGWYLSTTFSNTDFYQQNGIDTNVVLAANSWFSPADQASNFFISPSIMLGAHDTLYWKSAPYQTPRYLDGYEVLLSTATNSDLDFVNIGTTGHVLFTAAEMTNILGTNDSVFAGYSFSPGFVHGLDGTFTEFNNDSARLNGVLRTFRVPLDSAGYANQKVFIAFHHNSYDDNLISIDDIMIRGTASVGINENEGVAGLNVFPNPASDKVQVNYELLAESTVTISIYDLSGKLVSTISKGNQPNGRHFATINASELAKGFYTVTVQTAKGLSTTKLIVK